MTVLRCPKCNDTNSLTVVDTRPDPDLSGIRRRRKCLHCKYRFTTYEFFDADAKAVKLLRRALLGFAQARRAHT